MPDWAHAKPRSPAKSSQEPVGACNNSLARYEMKIRFLLSFAGIGALVFVLVVAVAGWYWERQQSVFQNAPQLSAALQAFTRDHSRAGQRLPPKVSIQELLREGYLTSNDLRGFEGMEVFFSTQADPARPQSILVDARTQDGHHICLMADGSVQQFSPSRYQEVLGHSDAGGQPDHVAAPSPGTNQPSNSSAPSL